jgi:sugar phosphate isomerase/epimerase
MNNPVGVIVGLPAGGPVLGSASEMGLKVVQLCCWNETLFTSARAAEIRAEADAAGITITSLWAGWPGPTVWDFVDGPLTLGLVPAEYRAERVAALKKAGEFARVLGVPAIVTHLGFIPENAKDPLFEEVVAAVRDIAEFLKGMGLEFWFETGQETPVTMLRLIQQVGTGNLGINLDPANLILYGKANPIDALDVFGPHVRSIHAKDGLYPTDPMKLGHEVKVGEGKVRFPEFVKRLGEIGFDGAFIIEREISGEQQRRDIADTIGYLEALLGGN